MGPDVGSEVIYDDYNSSKRSVLTIPISLEQFALGLGILGLGCFAWPILQRLSGKARPEEPGSGKSLRSPIWWAGFVLTVAAIAVQRMASQQALG